MVRQLQPWYANIGKRQVKAPKVYLRDSGLLHTLLGIPDRHSLLGHPRLGASWEGFALEQTLRVLRPTGAYFWAAHSGAELDLFIPHRGHRFGIDFKFSEAPKVPKSLHAAMESLRLDHLWLVYPGVHEYRVQEHITVIPLMHLGELPTRWDQKAAPPPE
jgi:predicted AAA+ superfamily ATPase